MMHWILAVLVLVGVATRTQAETKPHLVIVAAEDEYQTEKTLPAFASLFLEDKFRVSLVVADPANLHRLQNIAALESADLAIFSIRRRVLPEEQLAIIRKYLESGRPLVALRTTSHAFAARGNDPIPAGHEAWPTFDRDVLGARYEGHYGNKESQDPRTRIWSAESAARHPILVGVTPDRHVVPSWLYKSRDPGPNVAILQWGQVDGQTAQEPVSWTNKTAWNGNVFYTMLGHPDDFADKNFQRLLLNAIAWASGVTLSAEASAKEAPDPAAAEATFKLPEDLEIRLVLAEPQIAQPVHLSFDGRGRLWVVEYRQYPHPEGLKIVSHDSYYRNIYDKVPPAPPHHTRGQDRISIHADTNGDGQFDSHKVFVDGLNIAVSAACDGEGVWVLNPPYLLLYPDRNHDDVPDGDPEVHLSGFGIEDTHSVANSLRWGPDGWLYGAHGSTVTMDVRRVGIDTPSKPGIQAQGQLIWRYHPVTRKFEIFSEGGGNAFGVEIDAKGRIFSGHNGGDTRGFHYMQGAYLQKGFSKHGSLTNPFAFGYFPAMKHDKVPRFTHEFVIYDRGSLPAAYHGKMFGVAPLLNYVSISEVNTEGSTFATRDTGLIQSTDSWFRPVDITIGPDGCLYVADWYDKQCAHTRNHVGEMESDKGRVYRIQAKGFRPTNPEDLSALSSDELVARLNAENVSTRQTALRLMGDRKDESVVPRLEKDLFATSGQQSLEYLWAIYQSTGFNEEFAIKALAHSEPFVRLWTVRLLADDGMVSPAELARLVSLAEEEPNVEVRAQLACSARRLPAKDCYAILRRLMAHDEDVSEPRLPLLIWWAIEQHAATHPHELIQLLSAADAWELRMVRAHLLARAMQRYASSGKRQDLKICARLLAAAPSSAKPQLMRGFEEAFRGRTPSNLPPELITELAKAGNLALGLRIRLKEPAAIAEAMAKLGNKSTSLDERCDFAVLLGEIRHGPAVGLLLDIACGDGETRLREAALGALDSFPDMAIATRVLEVYEQLPPELQSIAQNLLASRTDWSLELLNAVKDGRVDTTSVPGPIARKLLLHKHEQIASLVNELWGDALAQDANRIRKDREHLTAALAAGNGSPYDGKKLFKQHCAKCHTLFSEGGQIGPDLTSYNRAEVGNILLNILDPSAEIREGFETFALLTSDGRALTGFLADQDQQVVALRGFDGQVAVVPRDEIESMKSTGQSLMPQGLLNGWTDQQVRDLFSYLRSTQPLND